MPLDYPEYLFENMSDPFYRAFEEKYRGSRELIKSRLQVYLPFVRPLLKANPAGIALDLGCGRGEWLELLGEQGFEAIGVDLDDGMLQACRELKLSVQSADAVTYLKQLPKGSLCIVSGFHIAEHLPFEQLQTVVQEALRVLVSGGLLILETPNPENITVGSNSFYLDPTHQRPLPPQLLSFLPEHFGFKRTKILRLQESQHLHNNEGASLIEVLKGVSPDYAVIAQKTGTKKLYESMNEVFETEYGLTLDKIAEKFQDDLNLKSDVRVQLQQALEVAQAAQAQVQGLSVQLEQTREQAQKKIVGLTSIEAAHLQQIETLNDELETVRQELHAVHKANHSHWTQLEQTKQELHTAHQLNHHHWELAESRQERINTLLSSSSWLVTAPLRWPAHQQRLLRQYGVRQRVKSAIKKVLRESVQSITVRPKLKHFSQQLAYRLGIANRLKTFIRGSAVNGQVAEPTAISDQLAVQSTLFELDAMSPRTKQIYQDLKLAIENRRKVEA